MDLDTITVAVDGSEFSLRAVPTAAAVARRAGASITLVRVATEYDVDPQPLAASVHEAGKLVPDGIPVQEHVLSDSDVVAALTTKAEDPTTVLCLASHDHLPIAAALLDSVGSKIIERARRPVLVVGSNANASPPGADVVVALDGRHDPQPLLAEAAAWADLLRAGLRVVTVYEPVLSDIRDPEHFTRSHGPASDPDVYLEGVTTGLDDQGRRHVERVAIPDPVSVAGGLAEHLDSRPAFVVVAGGQQARHHPWPDVVRELVRHLHEPIVVVPRILELRGEKDGVEAGVEARREP